MIGEDDCLSFPYAFWFHSKRLIRRRASLLCFVLLPLLILTLRLVSQQSPADERILVGVYTPEDSPTGAELLQALTAYELDYPYPLGFVAAVSVDQLAGYVAAGTWECGYVLPADLKERIKDGDYEGLITRIDSPSTSLGVLINEPVSAALLDICARQIAIDYIGEAGILPPELWAALDQTPERRRGPMPEPESDDAYAQYMAEYVAEYIEELKTRHFHPARLIRADVEYVGSGSISDLSTGASIGTAGASNTNVSSNSTLSALLRGLVALFLFLFICLCSLLLIGDRQSGFYSRLAPYAKPSTMYLPFIAAAALIVGLTGFFTLFLANHSFPGFFIGVGPEALCLLLYLVYLSSLSYFIAAFLRRQEVLTAFLPLMLTACLIFCPVLIDLSVYLPQLATVSAIMPPTFYLRAINAALVAGTAAVSAQMVAVLKSSLGYMVVAIALYLSAHFSFSIKALR